MSITRSRARGRARLTFAARFPWGEIPRDIAITHSAIDTIGARLRLAGKITMRSATSRLKQELAIAARHCRAGEFLRFNLLPVQRMVLSTRWIAPSRRLAFRQMIGCRFFMPPRMVNDAVEQDDFLVFLVPQRSRPVNRSEQVREKLASRSATSICRGDTAAAGRNWPASSSNSPH